MNNATVTKAASPKLPRQGETSKVTLVSGGSLTNSVVFTSGDVGRFINLRGTADFHLAFLDGASTASATAGDALFAADTWYPFQIDAAGALDARGVAAGDFYYYKEG